MNFSTDRNLLMLEPGVFNDVPFVAQERLRVTDASVSGTTVTSASADFAAAQVDAGSVVSIAGIPAEVVARVSATELTVSRVRQRASDAAIPPVPGSNLELIVRTFAPQAALVHDCLLRMVGVDPDDANSPITESMIVSLSTMTHLEALGTLERVYAGAVALVGENGDIWKKAADYHRRFGAACRGARIRMDLDGDGKADFTRELGLIQFVRR